MPPAGEHPQFPPSAFMTKVLEIGFGSGPWTRKDLEERWGASSANKFVDDGKRLGWLLSPYQNAFYVPAAGDLALIPWLPSGSRRELGVGRTLAAMGLRFWCLSAWLASLDLDLGIPLFVTDLGAADPEAEPTRPQRGLPFAENIVLVPRMPAPSEPGLVRTVRLPRGKPRRAAPALLVADDARTLRFAASPSVADPTWAIALAISLGVPRIEERLPDAWRRVSGNDEPSRPRSGAPRATRGDPTRRVARWLGTFGQPAPTSAWPEAVASATAFLLVPDVLWREVASGAFARRYEIVERLEG